MSFLNNLGDIAKIMPVVQQALPVLEKIVDLLSDVVKSNKESQEVNRRLLAKLESEDSKNV